MRVNIIIFLSILLASCTTNALPKSAETPSAPISCLPEQLIWNLHTPENVNELIGQYFSFPIPKHNIDDIRFKQMRFVNSSSSNRLAQIDVGNQSTLMLGKMICEEKISQSSPPTYILYFLITSVVLLPNNDVQEHLSLNCSSVNGVYDGSVAGWGYYEPTVDKNNKNKKPQYAWRVDELTESLAEIQTDNIKCWFGGHD